MEQMTSMVSENKMDPVIALASNHLGLNLYKLLAKEGANVLFSPFSISTALAMLFCGARNETAEEMRKVLGYEVANITREKLKLSFQKLLDAMDSNKESYTLNYANTVLSHKEFPVKEEYKSVLQSFFKALLQEADFIDKNEEAVMRVNEWVSEKTNNMISKLLDSLDPSTVMIILNSVYFKGLWLHPFSNNDTFLQDFYNKGDKDKHKQVDMMHLKETFPYVVKESYRALQLPYKGDDISMFILLPNSKDGLSELENSLSSTFIQDLKQGMVERRVEVALPKFKLEYSKSLKEKFQSLGLNRVFNRGAHLNGISDSGKILVSEIIHKSVLVVNEEGSEAAVTTAVIFVAYSMSLDPEFIVDHPFMFVIFNNKNDLILFMGRVDEL